MYRTQLLARGMFALNQVETADLAAVVAEIERKAPLCLSVEPSEHEEDGVSGGFLGTTPEMGNLNGSGA